jgi:hypothetical protein
MNFIFNHNEQAMHQNKLLFHSSSAHSQELLQPQQHHQHHHHHQQNQIITQRQKRKASSVLATKNLIRDRLIKRISARNGTSTVSRPYHNSNNNGLQKSFFEQAAKTLNHALFYPTVGTAAPAFQSSSLKKSGSFDAFQTWINYDDDSLGSVSTGLSAGQNIVMDSKLDTLTDNYSLQVNNSSRAWWGSYGNLGGGSLEALGEGLSAAGGVGSSVGGYYEMLQNPVFFEEFMTAAMSNSGSNSTLYYKNAATNELFQ